MAFSCSLLACGLAFGEALVVMYDSYESSDDPFEVLVLLLLVCDFDELAVTTSDSSWEDPEISLTFLVAFFFEGDPPLVVDFFESLAVRRDFSSAVLVVF